MIITYFVQCIIVGNCIILFLVLFFVLVRHGVCFFRKVIECYLKQRCELFILSLIIFCEKSIVFVPITILFDVVVKSQLISSMKKKTCFHEI